MMNSSYYSMPLALVSIALYLSSITPSAGQTDAKPPVKTSLDQLSTKAASAFTKHIDKSTSPNKKLVVAIGSGDGSKPAWEKVPHGKIKGVERYSFTLRYEGVGNYLIDIATDRVVALLDGNHFGTFHRYNHESATYAWSADSQWLVETISWKWDTGVCSIHRLGADGKPVGRLYFLPTARRLVSEWLKKQKPPLPAENRDGYVVTIQTISLSNNGTLTAKVSAERPKDEKSKYVLLAVAAKVAVSKEGKLSIKVTATKPVKQ